MSHLDNILLNTLLSDIYGDVPKVKGKVQYNFNYSQAKSMVKSKKVRFNKKEDGGAEITPAKKENGGAYMTSEIKKELKQGIIEHNKKYPNEIPIIENMTKEQFLKMVNDVKTVYYDFYNEYLKNRVKYKGDNKLMYSMIKLLFDNFYSKFLRKDYLKGIEDFPDSLIEKVQDVYRKNKVSLETLQDKGLYREDVDYTDEKYRWLGDEVYEMIQKEYSYFKRFGMEYWKLFDFFLTSFYIPLDTKDYQLYNKVAHDFSVFLLLQYWGLTFNLYQDSLLDKFIKSRNH